MSSGNENLTNMVPEDKQQPETTPPLSLFDQLKNSVDHNNVTKTALVSNIGQTRSDDNKFKLPKNDKITNDIDITAPLPPPPPSVPVAKSKPEFQTPTLFPSPSSNGNATFLNSAASVKRLQNANAKFPLKAPPNPKDLTTTLRSLKRSQPPPPPPPPTTFTATQKTGPLAYSLVATATAAASAGAAVSRHSSVASAATTVDSITSSSLSSSINHNVKKKRCTDRYDSSESSDR